MANNHTNIKYDEHGIPELSACYIENKAEEVLDFFKAKSIEKPTPALAVKIKPWISPANSYTARRIKVVQLYPKWYNSLFHGQAKK